MGTARRSRLARDEADLAYDGGPMAPSKHLALVAALAAVPFFAPSSASAQTIVLDAVIPAGTPRYFAVPFTVPEGIREIEVRHDDRSDANILDWGLADPSRFRGWGGGNTEAAVVNADAASRSYLPGAINAGQWSVLVGQAKVVDQPARYHVEIDLRATPTLAAQTARRPYVDAPALATGGRWYSGDFHVHSRESGDASPTLDDIATYAQSRGLDFVELSDHNTVSQLDWVGDAQARHPNLLFVPGIEVTTYAGHANAIGATRWIDFRVGSADPSPTLDTITAAAMAQGAVFSINHPMLNLGNVCIGCSWSLGDVPGRTGAVEIQNGQHSVTGTLFFHPSMRFWEAFLDRGEHVAPLGGSDDHSAGTDHGSLSSPIGGPTTLVWATELSVPAIVAAVRAGRTVVKLEGPGDPMVDLRSTDGAMLGDTISARHATLRATVTRGMGAVLTLVRNGAAMDPITVDADPFTATLAVDAPSGTANDRWRCELTVNNQPRVVTGHLWIAATGEAAPVDAGVVATDASSRADAGTLDATRAGAAATTAGGCGCRTGAAPRGGLGGIVAMAWLLLRRPRRRSKCGAPGPVWSE